MRWFKHLSNASEDETMTALIVEFGAEGYGIYWLILEKIATLMDENNNTSIRYPIKKWSNICGISSKKFQEVVKFLSTPENFRSKNSTFITKFNEKYIEINCPKLLKYRDEYSKKKGKKSKYNPDKIPTMSGQSPVPDTDTDTDTDIKGSKINLTPFLAISLQFHSKQKEDGLFHSNFKNKLSTKSKIVINGAETLEKLHRIDKESIDDIKKVLDFILQDTGDGNWIGWKPNVISLSSLRKKRDGEMKYFKIKNSMIYKKVKTYTYEEMGVMIAQRGYIWEDFEKIEDNKWVLKNK